MRPQKLPNWTVSSKLLQLVTQQTHTLTHSMSHNDTYCRYYDKQIVIAQEDEDLTNF